MRSRSALERGVAPLPRQYPNRCCPLPIFPLHKPKAWSGIRDTIVLQGDGTEKAFGLKFLELQHKE